MFRLALEEGMGRVRIAEVLRRDPDRFPCFTRGGRWSHQFIRRVLSGRAVLGEYQPEARDAEGKKVRRGPPVPGYYPALITEDDWLRVQDAIRRRRFNKVGRPGTDEANLFTGLVRNAATGSPMSEDNKGTRGRPYRYLSSTTHDGPGLAHSTPYDRFEEAVLSAVDQVQDTLAPGARAGEQQRRLKQAEEKALAAAAREGMVRDARDAAKGSPAAYGAFLQELAAVAEERSALEAEVDRLRAEGLTAQAGALDQTKDLIGQLDELAQDPARAEELAQARRRVKRALANVLAGVWVYVQDVNRSSRVIHVQLHFRGGRRETFTYDVIHYRATEKTLRAATLDLAGVDFSDRAAFQAAIGPTSAAG
jgi:hypothetical protein